MNLLGLLIHCTKGSPVYPTGQKHIGVWLIVRHSALIPHESVHGSLHFLFIHAWWLRHSLLLIHSGLHCGGEPI